MASRAIRAAWFSWPANAVNVYVPTSGVGPPQVPEATFLNNLSANFLKPGTRTTQAAGAVLAGNVVSSTPAGGSTTTPQTAVAYLVSV
jgi:hypothetical protein